MRLHPTRPTFHVALSGAALVALGVALRMPALIGFGGAILMAVAIGRAVAVSAVTRLRAAGFEMVWNAPKRVARTARGQTVEVEAELRNRGHDDIRGVALRVVTSSMLDAKVEPQIVDLAAGTKGFVKVTLRAKRVGRWGVHGMALEVRGAQSGGEGLYEVPLMFANPFGIEVFPRSLKALIDSPVGGRARRGSEAGRPAALPGEGDELRELRDHVPGDPFKRIAWKASARRGKLVVREMERDQRDVVWLLVEASVELWAGEEGEAPLDAVVDEAAAVASRHLMRGDRVGLVITATRLRTWLSPDAGPAHATKMAAALASAASMVDADRSDLDEHEVAQRVAEHARPLDSRGLSDLPKGNLDMLAARAETLRARAPFAPRLPFATTPRERTLRHYLASFGIEVPPRVEGERERSQQTMVAAMERMMREKLRPSIIYVWGQAPSTGSPLASTIRRFRQKRVEVRWFLPGGAFVAPDQGEIEDIADAVDDAVRTRARVARERGEKLLRRLGAKVHAVRLMLDAQRTSRAPGHMDSPPSAPPASDMLRPRNEPEGRG